MLTRYEPVIGLETHVELGTASKMFCGCPTDFGAEPNTQTCPVCLGLPGALPVANEAAIESTIRIGLALNCTIATWCRFARKNYFYPDMPKNFQTSQYDEPLCVDGYLDVDGRRRDRSGWASSGCTWRRTPARTPTSATSGRIHGADYSLVDYNRAGIPLVEIVTKPVPGTGALAPEVARAYVTELRDILRTLGVCDVRMEQGSLRCDVNTSLHTGRASRVGHPHRDQERQLAALGRARGALGDDPAGRGARRRRHGSCRRPGTSTRRPGTPARPSKEEATDYRYFPEPDLVPMAPDAGLGGVAARRRCRSCRPRAGPAASRSSDVDAAEDCGSWPTPASSTSSAPPSTPAHRSAEARNWWLGYLAQQANARDIDAGGPGDHAGAGGPADRAGGATGRCRSALARQAVDGVLETGADVDTVVAERGLRRRLRRRRAGAGAADDAIAANPDIAEKVRGGKVAGGRRAGRRGDEGDPRAGRRVGGPRDPADEAGRRLTPTRTASWSGLDRLGSRIRTRSLHSAAPRALSAA